MATVNCNRCTAQNMAWLPYLLSLLNIQLRRAHIWLDCHKAYPGGVQLWEQAQLISLHAHQETLAGREKWSARVSKELCVLPQQKNFPIQTMLLKQPKRVELDTVFPSGTALLPYIWHPYSGLDCANSKIKMVLFKDLKSLYKQI